ncbi:MAG: DoxX family protein [Polyangiaceae bacterium]|nr:DoxX family protein [Polyangiaceae bacterium]
MKLMRRLTGTTALQQDLALLAIRLWFGLMLAFGHGLPKTMDLAGFLETVREHPIAMPELAAPAAALTELVGGVLLALGLVARVAAVPVLATMLTAAFVVHRADPFVGVKELALTYALAALVILVAGAGRFSLDRLIFGRGAAAERDKPLP